MRAISFLDRIIDRVFISDMIAGTKMIIFGDDEGNRMFLHFRNDTFELIKQAILKEGK